LAGEKVFQDVLNYVSKSNLNFSIFLTPFSAQLSLKKSFRRNCHGQSELKVNEAFQESDETKSLKLEKIEMENKLTAMNLENLQLKKIIENVESKCKTLEGSINVEKKRIKKERQKSGMKTLDEDEFTVEQFEENYESNVPIFNKFETLQNLKCDPCADKPVEQQDCWTKTACLECIVSGVFFLSEANLNDHMKRNHIVTS
jgi:hypothetical protein